MMPRSRPAVMKSNEGKSVVLAPSPATKRNSWTELRATGCSCAQALGARVKALTPRAPTVATEPRRNCLRVTRCEVDLSGMKFDPSLRGKRRQSDTYRRYANNHHRVQAVQQNIRCYLL